MTAAIFQLYDLISTSHHTSMTSLYIQSHYYVGKKYNRNNKFAGLRSTVYKDPLSF